MVGFRYQDVVTGLSAKVDLADVRAIVDEQVASVVSRVAYRRTAWILEAKEVDTSQIGRIIAQGISTLAPCEPNRTNCAVVDQRVIS